MPDRLDALSPLDGRYAEQVAPLAACFSERALIAARVEVECAYLAALLRAIGHPAAGTPAIAAIAAGFGPGDAEAVKAIERETRHDVKAVEYWLKRRVAELPGIDPELVHLGLTSEDVNNLAWGLMHGRALDRVLLPEIAELLEALATLAREHRATPMLARTHGQPASPTTFGKELAVYVGRLARTSQALADARPGGKLSGATGTYAAMRLAYPAVDWPAFARELVTSLGLTPVLVTTQIEPRDGLAAGYDAARRVASVLLDFAQDVWRYVSDGWLVQAARTGEIGSSAMPHKVNPIDFENAEGNLGLAGALFVHLGEKLTRSRLQRDLSDSTVLRASGTAYGHLHVALGSMAKGLGRIAPDAEAMAAALRAHPEVLAEAIQVLGRASGAERPYEKVAELTRGRRATLDELRVLGAELAPERAAELAAMAPEHYVGLAAELVEIAVDEALPVIARLRRGSHGL